MRRNSDSVLQRLSNCTFIDDSIFSFQVIEKTKSLGLRTQMLSTNVERRLNKERDRGDGVGCFL